MGTPTARPLAFVALIGPPGVGKSTVSGRLAEIYEAGVFRLRDFAQLARAAGWITPERLLGDNHLGWLQDNIVDALIGEAFLGMRFALRPLVVCEGLPGTAEQVHILRRTAQRLGAALSIVELDASDDVLRTRVNNRRVRGTCEPVCEGRPHRHVQPGPQKSDRCRCSGHVLLRGRRDDPRAFYRGLEHYRNRLPGIRAAAQSFGVSYQRIDTSCSDRLDVPRLIRDIPPACLAGAGNDVRDVSAATPAPAR